MVNEMIISKETKEKCYQGYLEVKINTSNNPTFIDGMECAEKILGNKIESFYLEEITYWFGEHRGYVEAGMMWEASLATKHRKRIEEKLAELRSKNANR